MLYVTDESASLSAYAPTLPAPALPASALVGIVIALGAVGAGTTRRSAGRHARAV
jgi:hypothetical protein